ncbi:MAG: hypothetical protein ACD_72C00499G0001 [uncultured bacterium]|nr:MAG: hypothetical protein ACD_72C00499G0001 [uncultured bacterium]
MAANVVDFPHPVGPVTKINPSNIFGISFKIGSKRKSSGPGITAGIKRALKPITSS